MKKTAFLQGKTATIFTACYAHFKFKQERIFHLLGIPFKTFEKWLYEERTLPKNFLRIIKEFPQLKIYKKFVVEEKDCNWGEEKVGKAT